ncbi:sigma-70 family RNA polymerase sigma factor [Paenibacillus sp. GYB003]|uniref:sigma-70 family RNA polymerase sigma factor n=1 Tax=Paenibacillus sp. GYB003 TaxID=2994392 RepID=UPI002F962621
MSLEWDDRDTRCTVEAYRRSRKRLTEGTYSETELPHVNAMIRNLDFAIDWMTHAKQPDRRRGIENLASYQREISVDPVKLDYVHAPTETRYERISDFYRIMIQDVLAQLSTRERECYELAYGQLYTHSEIAMLLNIDRRNVAKHIKRAEQKLQQKRIQTSLFHVG